MGVSTTTGPGNFRLTPSRLNTTSWRTADGIIFRTSGPNTRPTTLSRRSVIDLEGFIEALGLETPVHLVGSSYGAYIAALVERDYPKIVRSAVLGEPPIESLLAEDPASSRIYSASEAKFAKIVLVPIRNGDYEAAVRGFIDSATGDGAFDRLPTGTKEMMLQNSRTLAAELPTPERDSFTAEDAKTISAPTLLVKGQNSAPTFQRISCRFWRNRCQMRAPPSSRTPLTFHMLQMPGFTTR